MISVNGIVHTIRKSELRSDICEGIQPYLEMNVGCPAGIPAGINRIGHVQLQAVMELPGAAIRADILPS